LNQLEQISIELAQEDLFEFTQYTLPNFEATNFHGVYYDLLDKFYSGIIPRLIISMPPQHGKSEGSSRRGVAYGLGLNPNKKIALVSYNHSFASKFNRDVQRIIDTPEYAKVFPDTQINGKNVVTTSNWLRNSEEFEVINKKGGLKTIGVGGGLTGNTVDILVMDDLYKDYQDATSPTISERVWEWYTTVAKTRLHNNSQELIVFTRWSENDLVGRLEEQGKVIDFDNTKSIDQLLKEIDRDTFIKINFEAIKTSEPNELDPRQVNEALWSSKHSFEKLNGVRQLDKIKFEALYQGNPSAKEGFLYDSFKTYNSVPSGGSFCYIDTADMGTDYLCAVFYTVNGGYCYVTDIVYDDRKNELTEPLVVDALNRNNTNICHIESNNGGRAYGRNIERMSRDIGNGRTSFKPFTQSKNKQARILSNASNVVNNVLMPYDWETRFKKFHKDITGYLAKGKNAHDDCADALTGVYEKTTKSTRVRMI
jgi:predicted phage terminase large subunit-like protein